MKPVTERNLEVKYFEKEEGDNIWIVESHMLEEQHDIALILEIDMEQMQIISASIGFNRYPLAECKLIEKMASRLIGLRVDRHFSQNAMRITMGPEGCPQIMTLLNISVPGIMYYYYPYKMGIGEITKDQFFEILREKEKNACLAHTMIFSENK